MAQEIERLNQNLSIKVQELTVFEEKYRRMEYTESTSVQEWRVRVSALEQQVGSSQHDNDDLRRRLRDVEDIQRKVAEYENRIAIMSSEIERLNSTLRSNAEDFKSWEVKYHNLEQDYGRKISNYEQQIRTLTQENEELKRQGSNYNEELKRRNGELEARLIQMSQ